MKDKLINALAIEYEAVYLIDLENDTYSIIKILNGSPAMQSSNRWSESGINFVEECSDDSKSIVRLFADPEFLKKALAQSDYQECSFKHLTDSWLRKACVHVIERNNGIPSIVLMTVSIIDKLTYQKEKMLQQALSIDGNKENPVHKTALANEISDNNQKLFNGLKILLVEDNEILRLISKETLENEGAIVTEAEDGSQAVKAVTSGNKFDFIIMDILMPVLDGICATREISEYEKNLNIKTPILGLTADATKVQVEKIIDAGAYDCLSKPLNPQEMSKVFISCMKEKSMLIEEKMEEINLLASTDMLTQAGNIVAYTRDIDELSRSMYNQTIKVAIVICDLDNLKGINDTGGHDIGDIYIKNCCRLISNTFKNSNLYRIGGDEFALIVKDEDIAQIDDCMQILNENSKSFSSIKDVINGKASVSAGYAIYDNTVDQSLSDTMKRADIAMYKNKQIHKKMLPF